MSYHTYVQTHFTYDKVVKLTVCFSTQMLITLSLGARLVPVEVFSVPHGVVLLAYSTSLH